VTPSRARGRGKRSPRSKPERSKQDYPNAVLPEVILPLLVGFLLLPIARSPRYTRLQMAPTSAMLQGLNIVHPPTAPSDSSDSQDLLGSPPFSNDLAAQLDLWSTVNFASDEPFIPQDRDLSLSGSFLDPKPDIDSSGTLAKARAAVIDPSLMGEHPSSSNFDFDQFLVGLGVDPFQVTPGFHSPYPLTGGGASSLDTPVPSSANPSHPQHGVMVHDTPMSAPPEKKPRTTTRKVSAPISRDMSVETEEADDAFPSNGHSTPLTPAEDKRRRNTAASARFRLKKKERELAMDKKAKDLENRVGELERECEALRRENGWLKGLVVGVTGGNGAASNLSPSSSSSSPAPTLVAGSKRSREDESDGVGDKKLLGAL